MNKYLMFILLILIIYTIFTIYKRRENNKVLKKILLGYDAKYEVRGKVKFSAIHKLSDIKLTIYVSKDSFLIVGYDYYRNRNTRFLVTNDDNYFKENKCRFLPVYIIKNYKLNRKDRNIVICCVQNCELEIFSYSINDDELLNVFED